MPQVVGWDDIAIRLVLALLAGGVIGLNRSERDRPAGLPRQYLSAWLRPSPWYK